MRSVVTVLSVLALMGGGACGDSKKQKRRAATLARLAKTDCKTIVAKAKRCDSAVREAADRLQAKTGEKHQSMFVTLGLLAFKSIGRCQKHVRQRVAFLKKNCKKYTGAAGVCKIAQRRYFRGLKALNVCFASDDCNVIAKCYVDNYAATQR